MLQADTEAAAAPTREPVKSKPASITIDQQFLATLRAAVSAVSDEEGWADLARVGAHIAKQSPEFDARNYGFARLSGLVEASGIVDIKRVGDPQKAILVRLKQAAKTKKG